MDNIKYLIIGGILGVALGVVFYLYEKKGRENLAYLALYDDQDLYKDRKMQGSKTVTPWPVVNTATTSLANIQRKNIEDGGPLI